MGFDKPLAEAELAGYRGLIKRRLGGEPVAYLVGEHEFWGLPLYVDAHVLVPRPDTETVSRSRARCARDPAAPCRVLDLCTGSGAIALALAKELPAARVIATDVSPEAVAIAQKNVERNGFADRVEVRAGRSVRAGRRRDVRCHQREPAVHRDRRDRDAVGRGQARAEARARRRRRRHGVLRSDLRRGAWRISSRVACSSSSTATIRPTRCASGSARAGFADVTLVHDLAKNPRVTWARRVAV